MTSRIFDRPPFQLGGDDAASSAQCMVDAFAYFADLPSPLTAVTNAAMDSCGIASNDPLRKAGVAIATDIDAKVGAGEHNTYHNSRHFCEVVLCTIAVGQLAKLQPRDRALVHLAALIHDFHHDGRLNGTPYRLEKLAVERAQPYLRATGVALTERQLVEALVLATEFETGSPYARQCYAHHFNGMDKPTPIAGCDALSLLDTDPRFALQAITLIESDILPSVGLTIAHAEIVSKRLQDEWRTDLTPQSKIAFLDNALKNFNIALFYRSNIERIRQHYLAKI